MGDGKRAQLGDRKSRSRDSSPLQEVSTSHALRQVRWLGTQQFECCPHHRRWSVVNAVGNSKLPAKRRVESGFIRCGRKETQASGEAIGALRRSTRLAFAIARVAIAEKHYKVAGEHRW